VIGLKSDEMLLEISHTTATFSTLAATLRLTARSRVCDMFLIVAMENMVACLFSSHTGFLRLLCLLND